MELKKMNIGWKMNTSRAGQRLHETTLKNDQK